MCKADGSEFENRLHIATGWGQTHPSEKDSPSEVLLEVLFVNWSRDCYSKKFEDNQKILIIFSDPIC